jgi:peptide/nickel transport system permease protein
MTAYLFRRVLATIPVLLGATLITFVLMHASSAGYLPGVELNPNLKAEDIARIRQTLGLDRPLPVQYVEWAGGVLRGDFGRSMIDGTQVTRHILDRLPLTLELTITAMLLGVLIAVPLGVLGARRRGSAIDHFLTVISVIGVSVPSFWLGLLFVLLFSISFRAWGLPWLPSTGAVSSFGGGDVADRIAHLILPATCLALGYVAIWSRFTRSQLLDVLSQDYIRTARAKGLAEPVVSRRHALRNALIPLVTLLGLELPGLVGGGAIIEIVFSWPGIGRLALQSALQYDYTMVLGLTTVATILVVGGSLLADILYAVLDPRIRYS